MKFKIWELSLLMALTVSFLCGFTMSGEQQELSNKLIRLHVVANSDSDYDQALKLLVRDAVLGKVEVLLDGVTEKAAGEKIITQNLGEIKSAAQEVIESHGVDFRVRVSLCSENFPTREYDTFTLPAGEYTSLRVEIGAAEGHNWWCVVFPALCKGVYDSGDEGNTEGLTNDEISLITEEEGYVVKFKIMEFFGSLSNLWK